MALSDLISRLEQEARAQVQAIEQEASARVHEIETETDQAAADAATRHFAREAARRQRLDQHGLSIARRRARADELAAQHALLARILERARALIPAMAESPTYLDAVPSHLEEALSYLEGLRPRVRCRAVFQAALQPTADRHAGAELVIDELVAPGVIVESGDRTVVIDNTLGARLARIEPTLAIALLRRVDDVA